MRHCGSYARTRRRRAAFVWRWNDARSSIISVRPDPPSDAAGRAALAERLGKRCDGHPEHVDEALPQVVALIAGERDVVVLDSIASALGRMWDPRCVAPLLQLTAHPDRAVRLGATQSLFGATSRNEAPEAIDTVVRLTRDEDPEIRDHATFCLAQRDADSPEIRDALWERLDDDDNDAAGEALVGLARRKDPRTSEQLAQRLMANPGNLIVEAAAELGDPALLPALVELRERGWALSNPLPYVLDDAIAACSPTQSNPPDSRP